MPLADSYAAAVGLALVALCPFLVLSTASQMFTQALITDLHTSEFGVRLADGLANAGYAFGAVMAADLNQRFTTRALYCWAEVAFAVASVLGAVSTDVVSFTIARTVQGCATGMLLVAALPPLVTRHGAARLPLTAAFVNLGLFGMVTIGPLVGGLAASSPWWRVLFGLTACLGVGGAVLGMLAVEPDPDNDRRRPFDWSGPPVTLAATALPFIATAWLARDGFGSPGFVVPLVVGLAALVALVVRQYLKRDALMPLRLIAHTLPVVGIGLAMITGAAVTAALELVVLYLQRVHHMAPVATGALMTTQVAGVLVAAWLFKRLLPTRWLPVFAFAGLAVAAGGCLLLLGLAPSRAAWVTSGAGLLLGFAAGSGVSPGLFMAGLSAPSNRLGPTFAFVELLRAEAAFLVGPMLVAGAMGAGQLVEGIRSAVLILLVACGVLWVALLGVLLVGGARPHAPDLETWVDGEEPAFDSPPIAAAVRVSD